MEGSLAGRLPVYSDSEDAADTDKTASTDTTPGGDEPIRWEVIGVNLLPAEAAIIRGRLESMDIPAIVQQESIGSVMGLTVGPLGSAKVLVPEPLLDRALSILDDTFEADDFDVNADSVEIE
ncbi:MAG: DUF2007 domain-containing protein [Chloroflexota bacterium]